MNDIIEIDVGIIQENLSVIETSHNNLKDCIKQLDSIGQKIESAWGDHQREGIPFLEEMKKCTQETEENLFPILNQYMNIMNDFNQNQRKEW